MCDDQSPSSWRISSARSVSSAWIAGRGERVVEPDLVGRERLHLHDLVGAVRARDLDDDGVRLGRVARPVDVAAGRHDRRLELEQQLVEPREHVGLDRAARLAQLLPVGQLGDDARALRADRVGRVAEVRAQLRVRELLARGGREAPDRRSLTTARISARWIVAHARAAARRARRRSGGGTSRRRAVHDLGAASPRSPRTCRRASRSRCRRS